MDVKCLSVILLVLAIVAPLNVTATNKLQKGLRKMIENWKNGNYGSIPINVPRRPLKMAPVHVHEAGYNFFSSEISIYGLHEIIVQGLSANPSTYKTIIFLEFPMVHGYADWYNITSDGGWVNNEGPFGFRIIDLRLEVYMDFAARCSDTEIVYFDMGYGFRSVKVSLSGALGFVENDVNEKIRTQVIEKDTTIIEHVRHEIVNRTISFLQGYTPEQLVQMFSSE